MAVDERGSGIVMFMAVLWAAGFYLRSPILIAPPLVPEIASELGLGQVGTGALTTVPMLMLSIGAVFGSAIIRYLGDRRAVVAALLLVAFASAARVLVPPLAVMFIATIGTGLGIAVMQPALAGLTAALSPRLIAVAIGVYMNGMYVGEFASAGLTRPLLLPLVDGHWRWAIIAWSLPILPIVLALWWLPIGRDNTSAADRSGSARIWPDWRDTTMWKLGLLLSASSTLFIGTNAYMAEFVLSANLPRALFVFNLSQGVVSLAMIFVADRLVRRRWLILASLISSILGALIFITVGGVIGLAAAFVLGMATAAQLTLVIMAVPYLAGPGQTGRMSAGIFTIGYGASFVVPLIAGVFAEAVGLGWTAMVPMIVYACATVPLVMRLDLSPA